MLAFTLTMFDDGAKIDHGVWRALLTQTLARTDEGLLLCDGERAIVFSTEQGRELFDRFVPASGSGARVLPRPIADAVEAELALATPGGRVVGGDDPAVAEVIVTAARVVAGHDYVAVWLRDAADVTR